MHWILDGYNVIKQVDFLQAAEQKSLAEGRKALLGFLAGFFEDRLSGKGRITVVFDGPKARFPFDNSGLSQAGIKVIFSQGKKADQVIEELIAKSANPGDITVVSADREVRFFARKNRCASVTPAEFIEKALATTRPAKAKPVLHKEKLHKIEEELRRRWLNNVASPEN